MPKNTVFMSFLIVLLLDARPVLGTGQPGEKESGSVLRQKAEPCSVHRKEGRNSW